MTSISSSQGGSAAYSNALAKLLERMQAAADGQDATATGATSSATAPARPPSLAGVLSGVDAASDTTSQAASSISSLMMDVRMLTSQVSAPNTPSADRFAARFSRLDADSDGSVTLDEFVSGRPKDMSESDANALFKSIDSAGAGSINEGRYSAFMEKNPPAHGHRGHGGGVDAAQLFAKVDTDQDGSLSLAEFVAGRPDDMSEEDATTLFKSIDTDEKGTISLDQFNASLSKSAAGGGSQATDASVTPDDAKALAQDILKQLMQVIQSFNNGYVDSSASGASDTTSVG